MPGITITLSGAGTSTTTTDTSGNYTFTGITNGAYTLTPSMTGYNFNPVNIAVTIGDANSTGNNFTSSCPAGATIVSASLGNDGTADGSSGYPFKTITAALATMSSGTVCVAPGTYDTTLGEVFPITLPAGVSLIGDETNKGQGTTPTKIIGGANLTVGGTCGTYGTTIYAGANSVIAGFELTNGNVASAAFTLVMRNNSITLRNNSIVNNQTHSIYVCNGSTNHIITGNTISNNTGLGLGFIGGGVGSKVENNIITNNVYGIEYDTAGGDLGGGAAGSSGGNTISCNSNTDLWTNTGITIDAANNFWDHNPPSLSTTTSGSGIDIYNGGGAATITTTGAAVAASPCP